MSRIAQNITQSAALCIRSRLISKCAFATIALFLLLFVCQTSQAYDGRLNAEDISAATRAASTIEGNITEYRIEEERSGCYFFDPCTSMTQRFALLSHTTSRPNAHIIRKSWIFCRAETRETTWLCIKYPQTAQALDLYEKEFRVAANVTDADVLQILQFIKSECYGVQKAALKVKSPLWPPDDRVIKVAAIGLNEKTQEYTIELPLSFNHIFTLHIKPTTSGDSNCPFDIVTVSTGIL